MKKVYIMRGLPYSGKSERAKIYAGETGRIHSTNDYFMVDGTYRYDVRQIRQAHLENLQNFKNSLEEGIPVVVCDNCNMQVWEFQEYIDLAVEFGYDVTIVTMTTNWRAIQAFRETNWRKIPEDKFFGMWDKFESFEWPVPASV